MKVSFNGARENLARSFNELVEDMEIDGTVSTHSEPLYQIRQDIILLLCIYDDNIEGDCDSLADVTLSQIPE